MMKNQKIKLPEPPKVGDNIYVPSAYYVYRGSDDFVGGLAKIIKVEKSKDNNHFYEQEYSIEIAERPNHGYFWSSIHRMQNELKKEFVRKRAHLDPDDRAEFNDDRADWKPV